MLAPMQKGALLSSCNIFLVEKEKLGVKCIQYISSLNTYDFIEY
jgi:hypothetical protein